MGRKRTIQPQDFLEPGETTVKKPEERNHKSHSNHTQPRKHSELPGYRQHQQQQVRNNIFYLNTVGFKADIAYGAV